MKGNKMKKTLLLSCLFLGLSVNLLAQEATQNTTCWGEKVKYNNDHTYCLSKQSMNWWSAFAWCKANGLHLATMYEMCPSWNGNKGSGKCPELNGAGTGGDVWSSTAYDIDSAFVVSDGYVRNSTEGGFYRNSGYFAFCI